MSLAPTTRRPSARSRARALSLCAALSLGCASEAATTRRADERTLPGEPLAPRVELDVAVDDAGDVVLELRNAGSRAVRLPRGYARIDVRRGGEPVRACAARSRTWTRLATRDVWLAPGEARRFSTPLGCAVERTGQHTLLVDLVLGDEVDPRVPAPSAEYLAASGTFDADRLALAPPRGPTLENPS